MMLHASCLYSQCRKVCRAEGMAAGVGPTHDDVTMAGVARALGYPLTQ